MPSIVPVATARRLLLGLQGLLDDPRGRVTADRLYHLIERMGFVQIDSINVVERAHHLTLASRLQNYRPSLFDRLLERDRRLFEHWTHDASAIPTVWYPYWWYRFERYNRKVREHPWWKERIGPHPDDLIDRVRERLVQQGSLMTRDFEDTRDETADRTWWGWKPEKAALEYLWRTGEAAIVGRVNFHKVYDLAERALPEAHAAPRPTAEEHLDWACRTAIERLGVASPDEIAAFWRAADLGDVKAWCQGATAQGGIVPVKVEAVDGWVRNAYAVPDWEERAADLPPAPPRIRLLSPFDPILRDRRRSLRLFGFDYRFEAFVPAPQRRYGYYVLPILEGERLVGRLDPKLYREEGRLEIRQVWWEPGVRPSKARDLRLEAAVERLARFTGAERWTLP
ncbi:MAG: crosslink repair DNA glycosylase YcaQ family protein [Acidobacteriota bacterium]